MKNYNTRYINVGVICDYAMVDLKVLKHQLIQITAKLEYNEHSHNAFTAITNNYSYPGKVLIKTYRKLQFITNTVITNLKL